MAATPKYKFRRGLRIGKGVKAAVVGKRLEQLRNEAGRLTPELVLQRAKNVNDVLHPLFQWDNTKAAHEYRLDQARHLIRAIQVVYEDQPDEPPRRVYVHVPDQDGGEYAPMDVVVLNQDMFDAAMGGLQHKLVASKRSYDELVQFANTSNRQRRVKSIGKHIKRAVSAARVTKP